MKPDLPNAVVMACDANYAPYALFLAKQIALQHPDRDFELCIFSEDSIDVPAELASLGIRTNRIQGGNPFRDGPNPSRHGAAAYLRLLLPGLAAGRYRRLLYLDSDIFLNAAGITRLFQVDMHGAAIAAVRDNIQWRTPNRLVPEFKTVGLDAAPYFNSGMLLIDVDQYQADNILGRCLEIFKDHPEAVPRHDQSLLNIVMHRRWTELSPLWNWQYTWSSRFFADLADPYLIHFIGPRKPWKDTVHSLPARYREAYARFLREHYPAKRDMDSIDVDLPGWPDKLGRTFLKHCLSIVPMKRYLDRFGHDMTTHRLV